VPLEYTIGAEIFLINAQIHCSNYKWQLHTELQTSHNKAVYMRSIKGNHTPVAYIRLKLISGRYFGPSYKDT